MALFFSYPRKNPYLYPKLVVNEKVLLTAFAEILYSEIKYVT